MLIREKIISFYKKLISKIIANPVFDKIEPNTITLISLPFGIVSALFFGLGHTFTGGFFLLICGILDSFDGTLARKKGKTSKLGAVLDSTLDRYTEFAILFGILFYYRFDWMFYIVPLAMIGSVMVSYVRARSEALGIQKVVGLMQRPERITLLALGAIINAPVSIIYDGSDIVLRLTLIVLAVLSNVTVIQRILLVKKEDSNG
jgi:CDP-diacylglycerol--glycerol-3-phosphate 3-phosphatidyltransferase